MSIYATLEEFRLPVLAPVELADRIGPTFGNPSTLYREDADEGEPVNECWVLILAQAVPDHIQDEGPEWGWLPPAIPEGDGRVPRAVLFVTAEWDHHKGTARNPQEEELPLLVMTGAEYLAATWDGLMTRLEEALHAAVEREVERFRAIIANFEAEKEQA